MDGETEQIVANLRACLISQKGGIPLPCLDRDYKVLIGHSIPFRKLGFDSLEHFLRSIPNVSISKKNGETVLDAIPSKNTEHLASLVARQKSAPRKMKPPIRVGQRRTAAMQWRPPPTAVRTIPKTTRRPMPSRPHISVTLSQSKTSRPTRQIAFNHVPPLSPRESQSYEKPPRFLRTSSREHVVNNTAPVVEPHTPRPHNVSIPPLLRETPHATISSSHGDGTKILKSIHELEAQVQELAIQSVSTKQSHSSKPGQKTFTLADNLVADLSRNTVLPDYEKQLRQLTSQLGLGIPLYTAVPRFPKGEPVIYNCKVKVGEESYTSYPEEHHAPAVALQLAAKNALTVLQSRCSDENCPVTKNEDLLKQRVSDMVASYESGVWSFYIPQDYIKQFREKLPTDWLDIVRSCPLITVDMAGNNRFILSRNVVSPAQTIDINAANQEWQQNQTKQAVPEPITYPPGEVWDVFVTCAITTTEVWIRLIGKEYNERYEVMSTNMEMHYMENSVHANNPEVGHYYAIKVDDCWHRVELLETQNEGNGVVFFLDHGDEETIPLSGLHVLEAKFAALPAQAIQVVLSGLEDFSDDLNATRHLVNTVIGKTLVAQVVTRPTSDDPECAISVLLYDTSTEEDINVNRVLAERISQDACAPRLPENGVVTEVFLSHVNEEGELFLNIKSDSFSYLMSLMNKLMEGGINEMQIARAANHSSDPTKLYLARYSVDYEFYRATIINGPDEKNWVTVQFVDYGNTETVPASNLLLLGLLSETLERFPHQAIRVLLHSVPQEAFGARFVERVRELVKEEEPVLVKVVKSGTESAFPEVEMFKRTEDKQFISINNTLTLDPELVKPKQAAENRPRRRHGSRAHPFDIDQDLQRTLGGPSSPEVGDHQRGLGVPQIPDVGQYFDVHVTMAANPSNFTVQPYKERVHLEDLMSKMQEYYNNHTSTPVSSDSVTEGSAFAAHHNDSHWYRATVSNVIGGSTVSVYFCDFGDVAFLPLDRLQPLSNKFKNLPAQAIKAKLTRIMPSHGDWSVEDCIRFQERVVEKQFVSVIVDSGPDLLNPSDIVIGLQLYDTSGNTDIEIDSLLVEEKRAIFTPSVLQQLQQVQQIG